MAFPPELSLECKPQSYSTLLKSFGDQTSQTQKLEEFLTCLEDERLKIDAFKRELPLCMQLLSNALEASRQQLQASRSNQFSRPVLEEFISLQNSASEGSGKASNCISDKANWMTSAQLWSQANDGTKQIQAPFINSSTAKEADIGFNVSPKLALDSKQRNGGAFLPFPKERNPTFKKLPELALAFSEQEKEDTKYSETEKGVPCPRRENNNVSSCRGGMVIEQAKAVGNSIEAHRKARRCWSPDLHRRFINVLQMLGGSQVATPKQIRELMKVDGLTNDEVKSHLQKYRLHTRRPSLNPQSAGAQAPQLVVLGGIWVPTEYASAVRSGGPALYSGHPSPHPPPHYCTPGVSTQEFYAAATAPPPRPHHHHPLHGQIHVYKTASHTQSSPESGMRVTGDCSESIEDGKSEGSSWKCDSGEHGGERKGLSNLRSDNEESNGSEITLKF